jgi:hypothetical protein
MRTVSETFTITHRIEKIMRNKMISFLGAK